MKVVRILDEREVRLTIPPITWNCLDVPEESLVWITLDSLSSASPARLHFPNSPAILSLTISGYLKSFLLISVLRLFVGV